MRIKVSRIKPSWLKILILVFMGLPAITNWPISIFLTSSTINNVIVWLIYCCIIWGIIFLNIGSKILDYLSVAFTLALITSFLGAIVRHIPDLFIDQSEADILAISEKMISLFMTMISVIPYGLFFVNCFSVSSFITKMSSAKEKHHDIKVHLALGLRVFQHVGDVITGMLLVWNEENPTMIKPRFNEELHESRIGILGWFNWILNSATTWCFALVIHTFEIIPYLSREMQAVIELNRNKSKK